MILRQVDRIMPRRIRYCTLWADSVSARCSLLWASWMALKHCITDISLVLAHNPERRVYECRYFIFNPSDGGIFLAGDFGCCYLESTLFRKKKNTTPLFASRLIDTRYS